MERELKQVLHMREGDDEASYAKSSYIQKQILKVSKSITEKAIRDVYFTMRPTTFCIADLGCSSCEQNNLTVLSELVEIVDKARRELGDGPVEYQICLNDLPGNDFNIVFRSVYKFENKLKQQLGDDFGHCFVSGIPGSFYGRLFPASSLHFVHSSSCLHWLSQVPKEIEDNKRNIYISRTSPPNVLKAYFDQFEKDFLTFLRSRSKEVMEGGKMVLTFLIRAKDDPCWYKLWDLFAIALNEMVSEGYIEEQKLKTFNFPNYTPSLEELEYLLKKENSFAIEQVHHFGVSWEVPNDYNDANLFDNSTFHSYKFANCIKSAIESLLIFHFGETIIEEVFSRFRGIVHASMSKEENKLNNVTISLTRRLSSGDKLGLLK